MSSREFTPAHRPGRGMWFVLSVVFIDMVGIGIAFPVVPILVGEFTASREFQAYGFMVVAVAYGAMQFLCAPILGAISDQFGRRPVLIAAIVGLGCHYLLIANANALWLILAARIIGGITGATFSVANAYFADISAPEDRAKNFGYVGAAFGLGFICGPILGGMLGAIDLHLPFYFAAALSFANAIYGYFAIQESLPPERRTMFALNRANPFRALKGLAKQRAIGGLVAVFSLYSLAHMMMIQSWVLYTHFRFNWGTRENGVMLFCVGVVSVIVQGGLLGRLVKRFGEERLVLASVGVAIVTHLLYGLAPVGWLLYPILFGGFLIFAAGPAIQGVVSKATEASAQGITLGALQSINSLAAVGGAAFGPMIIAQVAELPPTDLLAGAPFFVCATLDLVAFVLAWWRLFGRSGILSQRT